MRTFALCKSDVSDSVILGLLPKQMNNFIKQSGVGYIIVSLDELQCSYLPYSELCKMPCLKPAPCYGTVNYGNASDKRSMQYETAVNRIIE